LEINKTVIVASRWFLYYLTYIDDARSNTNQVHCYTVFIFPYSFVIVTSYFQHEQFINELIYSKWSVP